MRNTILILLFLTSINVFTQEEKRIVKDFKRKYRIQCENIVKTIIDKNISMDSTEWYEGPSASEILLKIRQIEREVDKSELFVNFSIRRTRGNYYSIEHEYTLLFYNEETDTKFGKIVITFSDRKNNLVDRIWLIVGNPLQCGTIGIGRTKKNN